MSWVDTSTMHNAISALDPEKGYRVIPVLTSIVYKANTCPDEL